AAAFLDNAAARLVYATLARGSSYGAAFPSSHVAATVAAVAASWQGSRRLGLALLAPTVLLTIGVVYCQMHYAVDALAGLALGAIVAYVVGRQYPDSERA
ncbi:MAG: phosphatase PAP2 family protein, partial [Gemmatimonadota bacterium]|nr:phosphatase PAP2 family protein [Gemmatimonadota bacterium]